MNTDKHIIKFGDLYYLCFQGVWFMSKSATGPWEVATSIPKEIYADSGQLAGPQRHLRHRGRRRQRRRLGDVCGRRGLHRRDGRVGLRRVGQRLVLPALLGLGRRLLPVLLPALSELRLRRLVQPVDRRLRPDGRGLRPVRRRRRHRPLQPDDRHVLARRGGLGPVRRAGRGAGLQPEDRHLRADPPGLERLRQLGLDLRSARRPVGADRPRDQQPHRHHDARDAGQRRRRRRLAQPGRSPAAAAASPARVGRRVRRPRRQRLQEDRRRLAASTTAAATGAT